MDYRWPELAADGGGKVVITRPGVADGVAPELVKCPPILARQDTEWSRVALRGVPPCPRPVLASGKKRPSGGTAPSAWWDEDLWNAIETIKRDALGYVKLQSSAKKWWGAFEGENKHRPALIHRLCEELKLREASVVEFCLAHVNSNTDNIWANLHSLDSMRLKGTG